MWTDKGEYTIPKIPDLEKHNLTIIEWLEEVIEENPNGSYLDKEDSFEEEDDHWTDIARSLSKQQLKELDERISMLRIISMRLREFQRKTEPNYYTQNERHNYVERRVKEGYGRWQAKKEANEGKLIPPKSDKYTTPIHRQPFDIRPQSVINRL